MPKPSSLPTECPAGHGELILTRTGTQLVCPDYGHDWFVLTPKHKDYGKAKVRVVPAAEVSAKDLRPATYVNRKAVSKPIAKKGKLTAAQRMASGGKKTKRRGR